MTTVKVTEFFYLLNQRGCIMTTASFSLQDWCYTIQHWK